MNKITIELCAEDRARLDNILAALLQNGGVKTDQEDADTAQAEPETQAEASEEVPSQTVTMNDLQQKVVALSAAGRKAETRDIVKKYAERVSQIPEDKIPEVWDQLMALEVGANGG